MKKIVLFIDAVPINCNRIRVDKEFRDISNVLDRANGRNKYSIKHASASRLKDVYRALLKYNPNIAHFSCHGMKEGIVLENVNGYSKILKSTPLANLLRPFKNGGLECVVFNYCFSKNPAKILSKKNGLCSWNKKYY